MSKLYASCLFFLVGICSACASLTARQSHPMYNYYTFDFVSETCWKMQRQDFPPQLLIEAKQVPCTDYGVMDALTEDVKALFWQKRKAMLQTLPQKYQEFPYE